MSRLRLIAAAVAGSAALVGVSYVLYQRQQGGGGDPLGTGADADRDAVAAARRWGPQAGKIIIPAALVVALGYGWVQLGRLIGAANLLVYTFAFVFMAAVIPASVAFFGPAIPGIVGKPLGKINWVFAMLAAGVGYLVQRTDGSYDLCWGRLDEVYIDGEWRDISGGEDNTSRLGWRPFRLVWEKEDGLIQSLRRDPGALADGGSPDSQRAGYETRAPSAPTTDGWLVNAVQLVEPLRETAGTALISRAEMQELKKQAKQSTYSNTMTVVGVLVGIVLGTLTGLAMTGAFG